MSKTLEELRKVRVAYKGWVTRSFNEIRDLLAEEDTSIEELESAVRDFDKRLGALDNIQEQLEFAIEEEELVADIEEADKYRRSLRKVRAEAAKKLKEASDHSDNASNFSCKEKSEVKLPRLELPKFAGELTEWQPFWDRYEALVDQSELPIISKFTYLQSLL